MLGAFKTFRTYSSVPRTTLKRKLGGGGSGFSASWFGDWGLGLRVGFFRV